MSEMDSILLHLLHIRCKSWLCIAVECVMEKENKEKRRENEQKAISTISQATATRTDTKHTETFHRLPTIRQHPEKGDD